MNVCQINIWILYRSFVKFGFFYLYTNVNYLNSCHAPRLFVQVYFELYKVILGFYVSASQIKFDLIVYFLLSSADSFYKQLGPRSGPTKCRAWSGSILFKHSDDIT